MIIFNDIEWSEEILINKEKFANVLVFHNDGKLLRKWKS